MAPDGAPVTRSEAIRRVFVERLGGRATLTELAQAAVEAGLFNQEELLVGALVSMVTEYRRQGRPLPSRLQAMLDANPDVAEELERLVAERLSEEEE